MSQNLVSPSTTWLTEPLAITDNTIYVASVNNITNTIVQNVTAPVAVSGVMRIGLSANKNSIVNIVVYNNTTSAIISSSHYSIVIENTAPILKITTGAWVATGNSLTITTINGNLIYINGEQIKFSSVNTTDNTLSGLSRGQYGTGVQDLIPLYTEVWGLLLKNKMNNAGYVHTWNSYNYNTTLGDPLQISTTPEALFLTNNKYIAPFPVISPFPQTTTSTTTIAPPTSTTSTTSTSTSTTSTTSTSTSTSTTSTSTTSTSTSTTSTTTSGPTTTTTSTTAAPTTSTTSTSTSTTSTSTSTTSTSTTTAAGPSLVFNNSDPFDYVNDLPGSLSVSTDWIFDADGNVNGTSSFDTAQLSGPTQYLSPVTAGAGSGYEIKVTLTNGVSIPSVFRINGVTIGNGGTSAYYGLTSGITINYTLSDPSNIGFTRTATGTVYVRNTSTLTEISRAFTIVLNSA